MVMVVTSSGDPGGGETADDADMADDGATVDNGELSAVGLAPTGQYVVYNSLVEVTTTGV